MSRACIIQDPVKRQKAQQTLKQRTFNIKNNFRTEKGKGKTLKHGGQNFRRCYPQGRGTQEIAGWRLRQLKLRRSRRGRC